MEQNALYLYIIFTLLPRRVVRHQKN